MQIIRFIGVPRSVVNEQVGTMEGWKHLGYRILERAKADCPYNDRPGRGGPHLRDALEVRFITGADPRMMIGSSSLGDRLSYVYDGTEEHDNYPVNANILRWYDEDGDPVFRPYSHTPARDGNPFILTAAKAVVAGNAGG